MNETTEFIQKPGKHTESVGRISIRAWLAIALIGAVVLRSMSGGIVVAIYVWKGLIPIQDAIKALDITEPLYTMSSMALAYYFGQQNRPQQTTPQP